MARTHTAVRAHEGYLVRRVVLAQVESWRESGVPYPEGSILMDAPQHDSVEHLIQLAEDKDGWRILVNMIKMGEGDYGDDLLVEV